jgi:uncharacterized protein (DUF362 family)
MSITTAPEELALLLQHQDTQGGWGYLPGGTPQVEPTALALLALWQQPAVFPQARQRGLDALVAWQAADGSFPVQNGSEGVVWPTALAILALHHLAETPTHKAILTKAAIWLSSVRSRTLPFTEEHRRDFEFDPSIVGWGWTDGVFSWVDPTAWACLALRMVGQEKHPRVQDGFKLLLDRAYDEGGVNAGSRRVFGRKTEPVPANTASFLLAFAGLEDHPRLRAARQYLLQEAREQTDLENLCWIRLALDAWQREANVAAALPALEERIRCAHAERILSPIFPLSLAREALAALALNLRHNNPLRPPIPAAAPPLPTVRTGKRFSLIESISGTVRRWKVTAVGQMRSIPATALVHIAKAASYEADLASILVSQYEHFRLAVPLKGKRVVLKPNFVEYHKDKVINTHPHVIAAAIELCRREGAKEVLVAEGPGHWRNVEYLVTASGLGDVLRHYKTPFTDLNHDNLVKTLNLGQLTKLEHLHFAETVASADVLISMPKLKTHHWAGVTLSLKNMFGTLPGTCYGWPKNLLHWRGIENSIVDIALTRPPDLEIVDGIIGMDGDGPINGEAHPCGVLVMGHDPVAVDATCCRIMHLNPEKVGHLLLGHQRKVGLLREQQIEQRGEKIAAVAQPFAPHPRFEHLRLKAAP